MAETPSTMLALGTPCPDFDLPDPQGRRVRRDDFREAPALLVMVLCNHCPFVKHLKPAIADFAREYRGRGLASVAVNPNDVASHPEDRPERMAEDAERFGYVFPYLLDESQELAKALRAACTPEFYLFDADRKLAYRGRFDATRPGRGEPTGAELRAAADAVLAGRPAPEVQQPSVGCNVKWRPGNEPEWA